MTGTVGSTSQHTQDVWVVVVDSMGCIIPNCAPTSVPAFSSMPSPELVLYPNPTKGSFTVQTSESGRLTITNLHGQHVAVYELREGSTHVQLPAVAAGIYVATFKGDKSPRIMKTKLVYQQP